MQAIKLQKTIAINQSKCIRVDVGGEIGRNVHGFIRLQIEQAGPGHIDF